MTENLFGAQTSNVLQTITRWLGGIFFALALLLSWLIVKKDFNRSSLQQRLSAPTVIPATPVPVIPKDVPTSLPDATSAPVKPADTTPTPALEKAPATPAVPAVPAPEAKPAPAAPKTEMPAPAPVPAPAPEAAVPSPTPAAPAPATATPAPAAVVPPAPAAVAPPAPAPEAAKPSTAPVPAPAAPQQ
jgi:cytoskeletal protein RodZ